MTRLYWLSLLIRSKAIQEITKWVDCQNIVGCIPIKEVKHTHSIDMLNQIQLHKEEAQEKLKRKENIASLNNMLFVCLKKLTCT
jgi:hypothetical protein